MREESWEDTTGVALSLTQTSIPPTHPPTHPPTLTLFPTRASPTHHHHHHRQHHHHHYHHGAPLPSPPPSYPPPFSPTATPSATSQLLPATRIHVKKHARGHPWLEPPPTSRCRVTHYHPTYTYVCTQALEEGCLRSSDCWLWCIGGDEVGDARDATVGNVGGRCVYGGNFIIDVICGRRLCCCEWRALEYCHRGQR